MVSQRSGATQLDLYALFHQLGDELSVGIPGLNWMAGLNVAIGVIGIIVQHEVGGITVKNGNNLTLDVPVVEIAGD
jgi:hypothetical protein